MDYDTALFVQKCRAAAKNRTVTVDQMADVFWQISPDLRDALEQQKPEAMAPARQFFRLEILPLLAAHLTDAGLRVKGLDELKAELEQVKRRLLDRFIQLMTAGNDPSLALAHQAYLDTVPGSEHVSDEARVKMCTELCVDFYIRNGMNQEEALDAIMADRSLDR